MPDVQNQRNWPWWGIRRFGESNVTVSFPICISICVRPASSYHDIKIISSYWIPDVSHVLGYKIDGVDLRLATLVASNLWGTAYWWIAHAHDFLQLPTPCLGTYQKGVQKMCCWTLTQNMCFGLEYLRKAYFIKNTSISHTEMAQVCLLIRNFRFPKFREFTILCIGRVVKNKMTIHFANTNDWLCNKMVLSVLRLQFTVCLNVR